MASSYEIRNNRLILKDNGEDYLDDNEKKNIRGSFTEIVFPACYTQLYNDDFKYCKSALSKVIKLDFSNADNIETISDDTFTGAKSLKVVVLPKKVTSINEFKDCPNLKEVHIYELEDLYAITKDEDKRLTVYASEVSKDIDSFSNGFLDDVGTIYVPSKDVDRLEEARDEYDDEIEILPLPTDYSFPREALSEPWKSTEKSLDNCLCPHCGSPNPNGTKFCVYCGAPLNATISKQSGSYDVTLYTVGPNKLLVVKAVNESLGIGLQKAKGLVDSCDLLTSPTLKEGLSKEEALLLKRAIEESGASVHIVPDIEESQDDEDDDDLQEFLDALLDDKEEENTPEIDLEKIFGGAQYHCVLDGKDFGPVSVRQFANMVRYGIVNGNSLVWKDGMPNWAVASSVADLQGII